MPRAKRTPPAADNAPPVQTYRYDEKRTNIPPAGLASQGKVAERPKVHYSYDPHLPPILRFDATGRADGIPELRTLRSAARP